MKDNLASELEWLTQNREAAKNAGFLYSVDSHSSTGGINLQIESGDAAVEGVCMSFADLCGSNKAKLGHQLNASSSLSISKKSFLSNLETKVYKHVECEKQKKPISRRVDTLPPSSKMQHPESNNKAQQFPPSSNAPLQVCDESISDEAFLDFDIDAIMSGSPKTKASMPNDTQAAYTGHTRPVQQQSAENMNQGRAGVQPFQQQNSYSRNQNQTAARDMHASSVAAVPPNSAASSSVTGYPTQHHRQGQLKEIPSELLNATLYQPQDKISDLPPNPQVEEDDEVAALERAAAKAMADLARARAAKLAKTSSSSSSDSFSGWNNTASEVQRRATGSTYVAHSRQGPNPFDVSSRGYHPENHTSRHLSGDGAVDYNQNVDYSNVPDDSNRHVGSSYDMHGGGDMEADRSVPLCSCGIPCVSLTSHTDANMGRVFLKCSQSAESGLQCSFFEWADGEGNGNYSSTVGVAGVLQPDKDFIAENKRMFGHNTFREGQRGCIEAALAGRDVFCLMPTGGGKSLVYQLPAWCCPGLAVVFSPLISLIQDQVEALLTMGIRAAYFSASKNEADNAAVFDELYHISTGRDGGRVSDYYTTSEGGSGSQEGSIKLLYLTPEKYKNSPKMKNMLKRLYNSGKLSRYVIDEAHCLSEWGHDFRPDYTSLSDLKTEFPDTPIMALTATANKTVADECIRILRLQNPYRHTHSFNRPNITYTVKKKDKKVMEEIGKIISKRQSQTGIVYCFSKKDTEKVCEDLKKAVPSMKNKITFYHAEVPPQEKERRQHMWSQGNIKVICATIAFGMGINKPDVRYVIHFSIPKSLTNYYQESGRAGRDGGLSESIVFYSYADKQRLSSLAQKGNEGGGGNWHKADAVKRALDNIAEVTSYCMNRLDCRRSMVLKYFGEEFSREKCHNTCDNCAEQGCWEMCNYEEQGRLVLRVLEGLNSLGLKDLTLVQLKNLITNSKDKKLDRYRDGLEKNLIPVNVKHMVKEKMVVMSKDSCDVLLQTMVANKFLTETSQATMSGFSAEYVNRGSEQECRALCAGEKSLRICLPIAGRKPSSHNVMLGEQLSDEQFLMFDIDAVVAGAGAGNVASNPGSKGDGRSKAKRSVSNRGVKRKGVVASGVTNNDGKHAQKDTTVGTTMYQDKKLKPPLSRETYLLSDSDDDDIYGIGHYSDIDDADAGSWKGSDIRSRNKGKAKGGALSLNSRNGTTNYRRDDEMEIDLTESTPESTVHENRGQGLALTRKEKADLREWLYAFRKRYHNYWVVLNNNSVHDIIEQLPLSPKALESVSGLGENKIRLHGDLIIATTWAFLHSRNMLSKLPAMVKGNFLDTPPVTVLECPSWRKPESDEAHEVQQRLAEAQVKKKPPPPPAASPHFSSTPITSNKPLYPLSQSTLGTPSSADSSEHPQQSPESPSLLAAENKNRSRSVYPSVGSLRPGPGAQTAMAMAGLQATSGVGGASSYSVGGSRIFSESPSTSRK